MAEKQESREEEIGLHNLSPKPGSRRPKKRIGRGPGSGTGKTSGRGHGGQGQRSGNRRKVNLEGGQTPIHMRMRKLRGPHMKKSMPFENFRTATQPVNVSDLEDRFDAGAEVINDVTALTGDPAMLPPCLTGLDTAQRQQPPDQHLDQQHEANGKR